MTIPTTIPTRISTTVPTRISTTTYIPLITEIKGHSLDDGPGIRSVIFFKGCPLSCVWCHNPETIDPTQAISYDNKECLHLGDCIEVCDQKAIHVDNHAFVDRERCTLCGECVKHCASQALSFVGKSLSVEEVVSQIIRYKPFFDSSGGGVTLSGGEATLYMDYCEELLKALKKHNISVTLETCGQFNQSRFLTQLYPYLDQIYFDIKLIDSSSHAAYCGVTNKTILQNFIKLQTLVSEGGVPLLARIPLIPGITTTEENLKGIADFLLQSQVEKVALLPYNPLWLEKANKIGQCGEYHHQEWLSEDELARCRQYFDELTII